MSERAPTPGSGLAGIPCRPGVAKPDPILVVEGVRRTFGGLIAVDVDRLEIQTGVITALIGPNGAGKTTLFNLLTGFDRPEAGTWSFDGHPLAGASPHRIAQYGMLRTFQLTKALPRMTVLENMMLGAAHHRGERFFPALLRPLWSRREREVEDKAMGLLRRFQLDHMRRELAGTLSGGQRKLLEMARALMAEPKLLMLDEPMAGVNPALTQSLLGHITELRGEGRSVLFIEHDMDVVMGISDWVVCLAQGRVIAEAPPRGIGSNRAVVDAYLGAHHDEPAERKGR
ncbi:MAG: ABC transporter ATP-binding protein [Actinomycetota bacterium]|nr:ABC transporter ATP-binding protein [Actinomycetota bacterium]